MASTAALSGLQGKFPLDPPDTSDREHNKLSRTVAGAGGGKHSALVPIVNDVEDLETAKMLTFKAVTVISPVTNLVEINPLITKTANEVADAVENNWISRYPRREKCVFDNGPEFTTEF